ncbi:MAG: TatD family deoxyribonuclease [Spirochaetaceae bacterium]|nr:TatD family deoxyribonuclease [Spirochaetaceae bacterium]
MFADTHCHFSYLQDKGFNLVTLLNDLYEKKCPFLLDIGTKAYDFEQRFSLFQSALSELTNQREKSYLENMVKFSVGIWPDSQAILRGREELALLESVLQKYQKNIIALGECGLDHHWNPTGVDNRSQDDFDEAMLEKEKEFFYNQILMGQQFNLPVIVHSRDAFEDTLSVIRDANYHNGIIHCYSYGIEEARAFLDLGWYISFSGSVTYFKKSTYETIKELVNFIPKERLLVETDAPYLAPVPCRGKPNSPLLIEYTYAQIAEFLAISRETLANLVFENAKKLFSL